jgi:hypothetical protein
MAVPTLDRARRKPLPAHIAALFMLGVPTALCAAPAVTNCSDTTTAGSLRYAITHALSGDVIDVAHLACSTISLTNGAIEFSVNDLTIQGPGSSKLTITGKYKSNVEVDRIFTHYGSGTLSIQDVEIKYGNLTIPNFTAEGGCIRSSGNVTLSGVVVSKCTAKSPSTGALGGAIFTEGNTELDDSTVKYSTADGGTGAASGGGVYAKGNLTMNYGTINSTTATGAGGVGFAGGAYVRGATTSIYASTISKNTAGVSNGGIAVHNLSGKVTIANSTISGNAATAGTVGGLYLSAKNIKIYNSTIALNSAALASPGSAGVGVAVYGGSAPTAVFNGTLIANNTYGATPVNKDFTSFGVTITGSNNLIRVPDSAVPIGTITGKCPLLGPLHNNGGPTLTHVLLGHSPAIDVGNNVLHIAFDQRGAGFTRTSGPPDIGAFEVDHTDKIFDTNFEGCP